MLRSTGKRASVKSNPILTANREAQPKPDRFSNRSNTVKRSLYLKVDVPLLLTAIILMVIGLIMVFSASYDYSLIFYDDSLYIILRQLRWFAIGVALVITITLLDYRMIKPFVLPAMLVVIGLLVLVLVIGEERLGAARTLFRGSIQPSELAKLILILYLAVWLTNKRETLSEINFGLIPLAIILGSFSILIMFQPDFSAVLTVLFLGGMMFFLAGGELKQILLVLVAVVILGWLALQVYDTGAARVNQYIQGLLDPSQASYHVRRSVGAFLNGGWFGVGIGNSTTKVTGLPVPHTDSIYAVLGEETGVFGSMVMVVLYLVLLWRGLKISRQAPDELGTILAAGVSIWIALEAFLNMAGVVNALPFPGNALPFVSSGGSNLIVSMVAIGILLNISRLSVAKQEQNGRDFDAVVDLRRRDGRRSVPRPRRAGSNKSKS